MANTSTSNRLIVPINPELYWDGHEYFLSSTSLGGSGQGPEEVASIMEGGDEETIQALITSGVCLPVSFPGDCALDQAAILVGDLTEEEEQEWFVRLRSTLRIPCGEFLVMGGGTTPDETKTAVSKFEAGPEDFFFQKVKVEPGNYLVEVYGFLGCQFMDHEDIEYPPNASSITDWWMKSRPGQSPAAWISEYEEDGWVDFEEDYISQMVRISLIDGGGPIATGSYNGWCCDDDFETRIPPICPAGLKRADYGLSS